MNTCLYYQAHVDKQRCWFFVAVLRSFEHMSFDRTLDKQTSLFEIFVPHSMQKIFEGIMCDLYALDIVIDWKQLPNRLSQPGAVL
jgi:hypothetical protein